MASESITGPLRAAGPQDDIQLAQLVPMKDPDAVLAEVEAILRQINPFFDTDTVSRAFSQTLRLYQGEYPGYQACNTRYHDFQHISDTFLAMARLLHGASVEGIALAGRHVFLGLACSLLHDAGYIQRADDRDGTGAKYTAEHIERSIDFTGMHGSDWGLTPEESEAARPIILCTDVDIDPDLLDFASADHALLGKMLGTADMVAQMADRTYLEKLLFLYYEFKESKVGGFKGEIDMLRKSMRFISHIRNRFATKLGGVDRLMVPHFRKRWGIDKNLYIEAIERQRNYLQNILAIVGVDPREKLKRDDIVRQVRKKYNDCG